MAKGIIEQQQRLASEKTNPSFFSGEERNIDAQIAKEQAENNNPIRIEPAIVNNGERATMTNVSPTAGAEQPQVQQRPKTAAERLQGHYATIRPKKPVYDPNRIEEINRLKRNNALAEGLKVLGDVFALAKGANVNRRQPSTKNDRLTQAAMTYMDNYQKAMDDWNYKDYIAKMKGLETAASQEQADRNFNFNYQKYVDQQKEKKKAAELAQKRYESEREYKKERDEKEDSFKESQLSLSKSRLAETERKNKDKNVINVKTARKVYSLSPEDASYFRGEALSRIQEIAKNHPDWIEEKVDDYGNSSFHLSKNVKDDDLIRGYIELVEHAKDKPIPGIDTTERPWFFNFQDQPTRSETQIDYSGLNYENDPGADQTTSVMKNQQNNVSSMIGSGDLQKKPEYSTGGYY
jgi:hypothetical protein